MWDRTAKVCVGAVGLAATLSAQVAPRAYELDYRLLATSRTSTMERELNEAAYEGFVLVEANGGTTEHGGQELLAVMERDPALEPSEPFEYIVLATNRTGTMRRELNDAARRGFVFVSQAVFETAVGGQEVVVVMERAPVEPQPVCEYELLATTRTSTMEDELAQLGRTGFVAKGLTVSETAFGGNEVVVVVERCISN